MKVKKELDPKIGVLSSGSHYIYLWYKGKRFRYFNGKTIKEKIYPNHLDIEERSDEAKVLLIAFKLAVRKGWVPTVKTPKAKNSIRIVEVAHNVLSRKLAMDYSESYKRDLRRTLRLWDNYLGRKGIKHQPANTLTTDVVADFVFTSAATNQSKRNLKRNISALLKDELESIGVILNLRKIKLPKKAQELHRPINDVPALLDDIKQFNDNLHLCCLMTYSMLLRPHREIRCLRFSDFNTDFTVLSLDGNRVKSKRNRIVPVPTVVREEVLLRFRKVAHRNVNLFSLDKQEYNPSYFKGFWTKYKGQSGLLQPKQTLYSLRHSAALKVFEKTGSLLKLQQVLGHSSMTVSLTYLRGLEVKQLDVEDLPEL